MLGRYLFRRMVALVPTLLGALTVIFMVVHLIPGDPVLVILGENFTQAAYDATQHRLGLDQPLLTQYVTYMGEIATGNFGDSSGPSAPSSTISRRSSHTPLNWRSRRC